jgi:signal transduction histidine kinase/CheY-like chemotaxis protein
MSVIPPLASDLADWLDELRGQTFWLAAGALYVSGVLLAGAFGLWRDPSTPIALSLLFFLLLGLSLLARLGGRLFALWTAAASCLLAIMLTATWGGLTVALPLLAFPTGLLALGVSLPAGIALASLLTVLILAAPASLLPLAIADRAVAIAAVWSTLGLLWLALRSLLNAVRWAWANYTQNHLALERARDQQQQLYETMEDLAAANAQLTRLNRLAQQLRQAAEEERHAKEQFVANVSHELRTPLNMIVGFCEMITNAPESYDGRIPPALLADLAIVLRNSQHLADLIDDVLDLSQIESGRMALVKERVAIAEIIESAVLAVRPLFASKRLALDVDVPADLPPLFCDRTRIREVVLNLLSNAGRFTEQGGVRVRAWQEGDDIVVSVADTGPGIAAADQQRLFRPFYQVDGTIRRRHGGTGLGLSISKGFVELHQGKMWVNSTVGQGTTFYFRLPIDPPASLDGATRWLNPYAPYEERTRPSRAAPATVRPRCLLIERGDALRRLLHRYLDGVDVIAVPDLEAAIQELDAAPVQALLINDLDPSAAWTEGGRWKTLPYDVPVIVCSVPGTEEAANALGVCDYLVKPIVRERLLDALERVGRPVRTVLVVDDEPDALHLFARLLTEAGRGYRVLRATNARQALAIARHEPPDVILLDLVMPEMDGFELLTIRREDPTLRDIPVILISARDPLGQPIVSSGLAVTTRRGLSVPELLASIKVLSAIVGKGSPSVDPALPAAPHA